MPGRRARHGGIPEEINAHPGRFVVVPVFAERDDVRAVRDIVAEILAAPQPIPRRRRRWRIVRAVRPTAVLAGPKPTIPAARGLHRAHPGQRTAVIDARGRAPGGRMPGGSMLG